MTDIIDFELLKQQRYIEKECSLKRRDNIDVLVLNQVLTIKEHAALLNILKIFQDKQVEPSEIFRDVFEMNRKQFEQVHHLNWWVVTKHCFIFLKILRDNNAEEYEQFFQY